MIAQQFNSNPFDGNTFVELNSLTRAGGPMFNLEHDALKIWSAQGEISGLVVNDIVIDSPTFSGLQLDGAYGITSASFENIEITNAGTDGLFLSSHISGDASFSHITISDSVKSNFLNYSPKLKFTINFSEGNVGWQFP